MIQTHAYDAWTRDPYRQGAWWDLARMQLGGFPARQFLFLAGVSLVLRYSGDLRRHVDDWASQRGALWRGLEVLIYGLLFRVAAWLISGAQLKDLPEVGKVDILNCIGVSLCLTSLLVRPLHVSGRRFPYAATAVAAAIVLWTPWVQHHPWPAWLPAPIATYLWDATPIGTFPQLPFLAYTLAGAVVGIYWMRQSASGRLGRAMLYTAIVGALVAVAVQYGNRMGYQIYRASKEVPIPAFPSSFAYRTGMCLLMGSVAYLWTRLLPGDRFSPLRLMGQASLWVYLIHVELVYGRATWSIRHRLHPLTVTLLIVLLTGAMVALSWWRIRVLPVWNQRLWARRAG